jgi:hypothetical protein
MVGLSMEWMTGMDAGPSEESVDDERLHGRSGVL